MKITIDNKMKGIGCGPPEFLYAPNHSCEMAVQILLNMFQMLKPLNWETLEYAKASFANNNYGQPYLDFLISLDTERSLGSKLKILARWRQKDSLFYGVQEKEEDYDNLCRFVKLPELLFLKEKMTAVSAGLTTAIQESIKSKIESLTCNTNCLLSGLNNEQPDKK